MCSKWLRHTLHEHILLENDVDVISSDRNSQIIPELDFKHIYDACNATEAAESVLQFHSFKVTPGQVL